MGARWGDGEPFSVRVRQRWSAKGLIFTDGEIDVAKIAGNETLPIVLDWYDQGSVVWRFPSTDRVRLWRRPVAGESLRIPPATSLLRVNCVGVVDQARTLPRLAKRAALLPTP